LAILREAGVVDSGGQGLYRLFQGALLHLAGRAPAGAARGRSRVLVGPKVSTLVAHADDGFGYETMFLLQPNGAGSLDVDAVRDHLESIGESVLVAGDTRALKIHVHNERPDQVIAYGLSVGTLSRISVENLDNQARDVRETRAASFTGTSTDDLAVQAGATDAAPVAATTAQPVAATTPPPTSSAAVPALGVLAVAAGDGLAAIFREFGVAATVQGGQSANPSTGELLAAIECLDAREIIILPNNPNVVLAARQVASITERSVVVVPSRNAAEGIAALLALDPQLDATANAGPMTEAGRAIQSLVVTEAVRDATIGGRKVKRGQTIALDPDDGLVAVNRNREKCVLAAVASLQPGFELVTIFYGDGADLAETEGMARRIGTLLPAVDVEVRHGGQPFYRYLIAAE
jgi:DAK2 domain fusion protein YloV